MGIPSFDESAVQDIALRSGLGLRVARLVVIVARGVDAKMKLAIGGAVAGCDAGRVRNTQDLDVFARPVSARRLMKALAAQGLKTFWITAAHGVAYLEEDNRAQLDRGEAPEVRVDVLSTVTEPEASAIRTAVPAKTLGVALKVFRPDHLAAIKFLAGRPQDLVDFDELVRLNLDLERVRYIVATADEAQAAAAMARARRALKPKGVRDRSTHYLDRASFERAFREARDAAGARRG